MEWPEDARRDRLIGDWHIYQRTGGHRTSTDDVITAWHATRDWSEPPKWYLDLGCGIGSVLLAVVHRLRPANSLGVEAQSQSVLMARRSVSELEDAPSIVIDESDFRDYDFSERRFDLVTGSPPYFPIGTGVLPSDPQRLACRFEQRGGVEGYCQTAAAVLAEHGRFHLVFQTEWHSRVEQAAHAAGLHITQVCDFQMRTDVAKPFLSTYELRKQSRQCEHERFAVRTVDGFYTPEFQALRRELGMERDKEA